MHLLFLEVEVVNRELFNSSSHLSRPVSSSFVSSSSGDGSNDCRWPIGVILSIASSASYCICSSLLSCLPEPNPCFQPSQPPRRSHVENETFEAEEDGNSGDNDLSLLSWAP
jgi:hypothetical protein